VRRAATPPVAPPLTGAALAARKEGEAVNDARPLHGRVALVTGAARGIGRGIAVELARAGADVCVNDLKDQAAAAESTVRDLEALGVRALYAAADVSQRTQVEKIVDLCEARLGPVDILVSNAVTSTRHTLLETPFEELRRAVEVGIYGAFHVMQVVARRMVRAGRPGSIVQITSPFARLAYRGGIDYTVAKSGAHMLAMAAANELAWHGVRVNLVEPGWTDTPSEHRWFSDAVLAEAGRNLPLGRLAEPADVGRAVVFLATEPYIVGTVLYVDGGLSLAWYAPVGEDPRRRPVWTELDPSGPTPGRRRQAVTEASPGERTEGRAVGPRRHRAHGTDRRDNKP
jgi:glucose 1-dehydrogenase